MVVSFSNQAERLAGLADAARQRGQTDCAGRLLLLAWAALDIAIDDRLDAGPDAAGPGDAGADAGGGGTAVVRGGDQPIPMRSLALLAVPAHAL